MRIGKILISKKKKKTDNSNLERQNKNVIKEINTPIIEINREKILEEANLLRKEILRPKNLTMQKKTLHQQNIRINKKE